MLGALCLLNIVSGLDCIYMACLVDHTTGAKRMIESMPRRGGLRTEIWLGMPGERSVRLSCRHRTSPWRTF